MFVSGEIPSFAELLQKFIYRFKKTNFFFFFFFNRRILLHGKNSQKRDNIKRKITKQQTT